MVSGENEECRRAALQCWRGNAEERRAVGGRGEGVFRLAAR